MKMGVFDMPPMLLGAFRYALTAFPAILLIKRPKIEFRYLVAYGLTVGLGQFGCLFYALKIGMPASIASILLQTQVFITCILGMYFLNEKMAKIQFIGLLIAVPGLLLIGSGAIYANTIRIPAFAIFLTLSGAFFWAVSNVVVRFSVARTKKKKVHLDMLGFIVWSSLIPPVPFFILALIMESPFKVLHSITNLNSFSLFVIFYNAFLATLFGFGFWSRLLARYPVAYVAPFSLLVPVTGLLTARLVLLEHLSATQWIGCIFIFCGLAINTAGQSLKKILQKHPERDQHQ